MIACLIAKPYLVYKTKSAGNFYKSTILKWTITSKFSKTAYISDKNCTASFYMNYIIQTEFTL